MYRIGFIILALAAVALGLLVGTLNSDPVVVDLLWIQIEWPLGLVVLLGVVIGLALGIAMMWLTHVLPARLQLRRLRKDGGGPTLGGNDG